MLKPFISLAVCILTIATTYSQDQERLVNNPDQLLSVSNGVRNSYGSIQSIPPVARVEGTPYLFDDWIHSARVYATNGQLYMLDNINLNLNTQAFVTKIGQDSLFTFQFNQIDYFEVLGRKYESKFTKTGRQIYEVIADYGDDRLLRAYTVKLVPSSPDPMKNRPVDKYIRRENFYYEHDDKITLMPLRKGRVLKSFDLEKPQEKELVKYVKQNDLSYGDEKDIIKMMDYVNSL